MRLDVNNYSRNLCPDSIFGQIRFSNKWSWIKINAARNISSEDKDTGKSELTQLIDASPGNPIIILVLESPHSNEYLHPNNPVAANGPTGQNIYDHLCEVFNNYNSGNKFVNSSNDLNTFLKAETQKVIDVWAVNSIQYQCSLGISPICHIIKESNWVDEWFSSRNDFSVRIKKLINSKNYFVINLCTNGVYVPMKKLVSTDLTNNIAEQKICIGPHPSSWEALGKVQFK